MHHCHCRRRNTVMPHSYSKAKLVCRNCWTPSVQLSHLQSWREAFHHRFEEKNDRWTKTGIFVFLLCFYKSLNGKLEFSAPVLCAYSFEVCFWLTPPPSLIVCSVTHSSTNFSSSSSSLCLSQHDSQWSPSPCTLCVCSRGSVTCGPRPCPPLSCPEDQSPFTPAGECCPKCGHNGGERSF